MKSIRVLCVIALAIASIPFVPARVDAAKDEWLPVDPAQLALKTSTVEKDADAEVLYWDVRLQHADGGFSLKSVLTNYVRIKIFTEHGKETQSQIDLPYATKTKITDIAARTIKPDGTIVEVQPNAVFDRTIVKTGNIKVNSKSFAMPGVEPGAIIEYRWQEVRTGGISGYTRIQFQRDIPVQRIICHIKPYNAPDFPLGMRTQMFHGRLEAFVKEDGGFYKTSMTNIPAFREEPHMPPEDQVRPWLLVYYGQDSKSTPETFWPDYGKRLYNQTKSLIKVNDEIKKAAADLTANASTPEQKLERLYEFCRTEIKNTDNDEIGLTDDDRAKLKENKQPSDTLKRREGTGLDIMFLFASLATAAGFDARVAALPDRSDTFFDPSFPDDYFLSALDIAVKVGDTWRICDPARRYTPFGMLLWQEEGQQALVSDPKTPLFVETPMSKPAQSLEKRTATLRLTESGDLEGDVRVECTGHIAATLKEINDDDTKEEREQWMLGEIKRRMSTADVANIQFENVDDPNKPFVCTYHIRVAGYAQRTGKRLFLQPAFFQKGEETLFKATERTHMIYFHYPWSEEDQVTIDLPSGYTLDNAEAPEPLTAGPIGACEARVFVTNTNDQLVFKRKFFFCGNDSLYFPASGYAQLKKYFDAIYEQDNHTITLKQAAAQ